MGDRVDVCDEQCKAAKLRASKAEDEVDELMTKARQLETELDLTTEKLGIATLQRGEGEQLAASELEMNALNRRVSGLEEDLEKTEEKMVAAVAKLDKAATAADDSSVPRRCSRARPTRMRRGSPGWRRSSRRPGRRLRPLTLTTMRLRRS